MSPSRSARKAPAKKAAAKKAPPKKAAVKADGFGPVFTHLRGIMATHGPALAVKTDTPDNYYVNSTKPYNKKDLFFGAVQTKKNYVSYHLFPLYMFPELLKGVSPELKKRMQGKTCFNFTSVEEGLFGELAALTRKGFEEFKRRELV
ncbi:MAG TPA: hypothetical protein VF815_29800 [Myxococcaceae bacterium]|jgi:hypothetical protein